MKLYIDTMIGNLSKSYVSICSFFSVVLIFGKLFHATFLHIINMCTFGLFIHDISFAHQYVHTSFFLCTSTCAHIYVICTSTCAHIYLICTSTCAHIFWIIHPQIFICTSTSAHIFAFARQHVHKHL